MEKGDVGNKKVFPTAETGTQSCLENRGKKKRGREKAREGEKGKGFGPGGGKEERKKKAGILSDTGRVNPRTRRGTKSRKTRLNQQGQ